MLFFGLVKMTLKIRHFATEEPFVVGQTDDNVILGMPFLTEKDWSMDYRLGSDVTKES